MYQPFISMFRRAFLRCYLCRLQLDGNQPICCACRRYFIANHRACRACAMPITAPTDTLCGQCQKKTLYITNTYAPWQYEQPLKRLIRDFKYHGHLWLASFLTQCMLEINQSIESSIDYLIPMPIHAKRLQHRGFNQTSLLAKMLSKHTHLPVNQALCKRITFYDPQAKLNQQQRHKNARNAFACHSVEGKHLMIIDDLITTGATAESLAKELTQKGAKQVDLWCIARNF